VGSSGVTPASSPTEQTGGKKQQSANQREYRFYRDTDKSQWQRQKPDCGKKDQREQRQGPAKRQQDAPAHK